MALPDVFSAHADPSTTTRKRRRRAPTAGANDDCFSCQKNNSECDRRRPYCTPCLQLGKDCSGYKTVLTWGVGVASRGKLRGMSLPVAKPVKAVAQPSSSATRGSSFSVPDNVQFKNTSQRTTGSQAARQRAASIRSKASPPGHDPTALDAARCIQHLANSAGQHQWTVSHNTLSRHSSTESETPDLMQPPDSYTARRLHLTTSNDEAIMSSSASSAATPTFLHATNRFPSSESVIFSPTSVDISFIDPFLPHATLSPQHYTNDMPGPPLEQYTEYHDPKSMPTGTSADEYNTLTALPAQDERMSIYETSDESIAPLSQDLTYIPTHFDQAVEDSLDFEDEVVSQASQSDMAVVPTLPYTISAREVCPMSPRLQYLLDYYDKAICPVLVAFDGPTNPYRVHVMRLVAESPGLQNALGALAINNMRNRGLLDVPHLAIKPGKEDNMLSRMAALIGSPTPEEQHYKSMSIEMLNAQLADPLKARDDSILATLLLLCLFHACDSGFSKFKTQLSGVQKLLRLRGKTASSNFLDWVEMFFSWFDVMTSAVNDRETQIRGTTVDIMDITSSMGALEEFSGCDGRLFKIIARLSRLNLLSQGRPVRETPQATPMASPPPEFAQADGSQSSEYYSLRYDQMDGNGWAKPLVDCHALPVQSDGRVAFWREWTDIRHRLEEWELDHLYASLACGSSSVPGPQRDQYHISESFRYAALLYTERLAYPRLPPSSSNFQNLVSQALYHIDEIGMNSCVLKFLLWPLFIAGSECVYEQHRDMIRSRCFEIQRESGFYNNLSSLAVLERLWLEGEGQGEHARGTCGAQAFRWRKAMMDRVDGEYIVV